MKTPMISYYGPTKTPQLNARREDYPGITLFYSYDTVIAFQKDGILYARVNDWSTTTGKHLNALEPDHSKRIEGEEFERLLESAKESAGLS